MFRRSNRLTRVVTVIALAIVAVAWIVNVGHSRFSAASDISDHSLKFLVQEEIDRWRRRFKFPGATKTLFLQKISAYKRFLKMFINSKYF